MPYGYDDMTGSADPYSPNNYSNVYSLGNPNPSDVGGSYGYPSAPPDPNAGYVNQSTGSSPGSLYPQYMPQVNGGGQGGSQIPWNQVFDNSLGNRQLDQSQQYLNYMTNTYYPFEQQMQQNVFDLQKQLQQAQMTGDYAGVQTLQAKLQQAQISLQNQQANQQASMQNAQMSGEYNGAPTLEAQQMMNTGALNQGNQYLTARGQDTSYDQSLMGMATNFANIQAQMAQSPLVAWYTARGLPPPNSALMASNFQQTLAQTPQFQGLGQYQAPQLNWSFHDSQPGVGMLPTATNAGPQYSPTGQPINFQNPTGGGYGPTAQPNMMSGQPSTLASPNQALGAPSYQGQPWYGPNAPMQPLNATAMGAQGPATAQNPQMMAQGQPIYAPGQPMPSSAPATPGATGTYTGPSPVTNPINSSMNSSIVWPASQGAPAPGSQPVNGAPPSPYTTGMSPTNVQVPPSAPPPPSANYSNSWMTPSSVQQPQTQAQPMMPAPMPQNYDPSMSQGAAPWATSLVNNTVMPSYVGNNGGVNVASAQQWGAMNPAEQQAASQAAAMAGNPYYAQNVYSAAPEWGAMGPAQYQGY